MNSKLLINTALFGVVFGALNSFGIISENYEWIFWFGFLIFCAFMLKRKLKKDFLIQGIATGFVFSVLVYVTQSLLIENYCIVHPDYVKQVRELSSTISISGYMMFSGLIISAIYAVAAGAFSLGLVKFSKRN